MTNTEKIDYMLELEKRNVSPDEWLQVSIPHLKEMLYTDPLSLDDTLTYHRHFLWKLGFNPSEQELKPISFYLSQFGIYRKRVENSSYHYQHLYAPIHIKVIREVDGFRINAHIDVKPHKAVKYSNFTSKLLSDLSIYLQLRYNESNIIFYNPPAIEKDQDKARQLIKSEECEVSEFIEEGILDVDAKMDIEESISHEILDSQAIKLNETIIKTNLYVKNLIEQYEARVKTFIVLKRKKELRKLVKKEQYHYRMSALELLKKEWRDLCKEIINISLEEECDEILSHQIFLLDPKLVEDRIREIMSKILQDIHLDSVGFLLLEFSNLLKTYFLSRLVEMQRLLRKRQKVLEEKRAKGVKSVCIYIENFLSSLKDDILLFSLSNNQRKLNKSQIKKFALEFFEEQLTTDKIMDKKLYLEQFDLSYVSSIEDVIKEVERMIRTYEKYHKIVPRYRFRDFLKESWSNVFCFCFILLIPAILITVFIWWGYLPKLELYTLWAENLWVNPVIISLFAVEIILILVLRAFIKARKVEIIETQGKESNRIQ
ncbi:MAG: hypothetical protein ACFFDF_04880 [Candidatus Odinarchaeota archaeon]